MQVPTHQVASPALAAHPSVAALGMEVQDPIETKVLNASPVGIASLLCGTTRMPLLFEGSAVRRSTMSGACARGGGIHLTFRLLRFNRKAKSNYLAIGSFLFFVKNEPLPKPDPYCNSISAPHSTIDGCHLSMIFFSQPTRARTIRETDTTACETIQTTHEARIAMPYPIRVDLVPNISNPKPHSK